MTVSTTSFCTTYMKQCLNPGESNHPLAALGIVAQTPRDVAADFYLHTRLAEVDVAVAVELKVHHVLQILMNALRLGERKVRRSDAFREVMEDWQRACWISERFRSTQGLADAARSPRSAGAPKHLSR